MLRLPNIEEIHRKLMQIPQLIDRYAAGDESFIQNTLSWFCEVEKILLANRLTIAAELATMRASIISAHRAPASSSTLHLRRREKRRGADATAATTLRSAVELITRRIDQDLALIGNAEKATYELVILARQLKLIPDDFEPKQAYSHLRPLWDQLAANEQTAKHTTYIRSVVGPGDALILLDRVLAQWQGPIL